MAMGEVELWRTAAGLIRAYGEEAEIQALARADAALDGGDIDAFNDWKKVARLIAEMGSKPPRGGAH